MSKSEVPKFELPILYLCLLIFFAGLGWMVSVFLLGKIYSANMTVHYLTSLIWEILKIIFIGTSVAIIVNQFILKPILSMPPRPYSPNIWYRRYISCKNTRKRYFSF